MKSQTQPVCLFCGHKADRIVDDVPVCYACDTGIHEICNEENIDHKKYLLDCAKEARGLNHGN